MNELISLARVLARGSVYEVSLQDVQQRICIHCHAVQTIGYSYYWGPFKHGKDCPVERMESAIKRVRNESHQGM